MGTVLTVAPDQYGKVTYSPFEEFILQPMLKDFKLPCLVAVPCTVYRLLRRSNMYIALKLKNIALQ